MQQSTNEKTLYWIAFTCFAVMVVTLLAVVVGVLPPPRGLPEDYDRSVSVVRQFAFLFGAMFAPGTIMVPLFLRRVVRRQRGFTSSVGVDCWTILATLWVVLAYQTIINL